MQYKLARYSSWIAVKAYEERKYMNNFSFIEFESVKYSYYNLIYN